MDKLHIGTESKDWIHTDLRAQRLPAQSMAAEVLTLRKEDEVRVADVHHCARNIAGNTLDPYRTTHHPRHTHAGLDPPGPDVLTHHAALPQSTVRPQRDLAQTLTGGQPGGYATCTVPAQLGLTAIRVEEAQKQAAVRSSFKKFDPIRTDAGVARTELLRQRGVLPLRDRLFHDQEIVAARVRFHKRNPSAQLGSSSRA